MAKSIAIFILICCACAGVSAQEKLYNHVYWEAQGTHTNELLGLGGLDTIGKISDAVEHALAIGADGGSSYVRNQVPFDTLRQYKFPGQKVLRCSLNGDSYPDFVCWDANLRKITVLFGTAVFNQFNTALVLNGD